MKNYTLKDNQYQEENETALAAINIQMDPTSSDEAFQIAADVYEDIVDLWADDSIGVGQ